MRLEATETHMEPLAARQISGTCPRFCEIWGTSYVPLGHGSASGYIPVPLFTRSVRIFYVGEETDEQAR